MRVHTHALVYLCTCLLPYKPGFMTKTEKSILALWFIMNLLIGAFIAHDYGISYDEPDYFLYAQNTVDAYKSLFALAYTPVFGPHDLPNYGPAFIIFPELAIRFLKLIFPNILAADVWHFSYFLLFQLGGLSLYALARRWFNSWSAWGVLLLYTSQPLLWGHAFINPKDIPFMVFCLITIWSGLRLADALGAQNRDASFHLSKNRPLPRFALKDSLPFLRSPQLILAGILFGLTMSIRLLGPLPGLIVILYLVLTMGESSLSIIAAYIICAGVTMFITWPALWPNPIGHWLDSLVLMVNFPWPGRVLFNGAYYDADKLPISYLPALLNIQLTEPLLILIYPGLAALIFFSLHKRIKLDLFLVLVIGALLPLTGLILSRATMYDNFRQILFLIPPLLLLAGLVLEVVFSILKPLALRILLLIALAFPGFYAIALLHPYQYVYYNSLVGGVAGASRRFDLDYWFTSYRETALWLNENIPQNANVTGDGPIDLLYTYLRSDLNPENKADLNEPDDYFVATTRYNHDLTLFPDANVIHSIERLEADLCVIKQLSP
jgi:hypothetical protein